MKSTPTFDMQHSNINLLWASMMIEELVRHGITDFCIAPGSRSTPLTLAVSANKKATPHVHFDERGLGFLALGLSVASRNPIVLITTSGSAVANLHPAMIEAGQSGLPLIVLSADRPPELIDCGANQAINQSDIFNSAACFFAQIPSPSVDVSAGFLLTTIDHGLLKQKQDSAPIHFNCAFPEPLYPTELKIDYQDYLATSVKNWTVNQSPYTQIIEPKSVIEKQKSLIENKKILVISGRFSGNISQFCKDNNFPLLADIQSSQGSVENNLHHYDLALLDNAFSNKLAEADIVLQFGEKLISKRLGQFIEKFTGEYWLVAEGVERIDPTHQVSTRFRCNSGDWIAAYSDSVHKKNNQVSGWIEELASLHQTLSDKVIAPFVNSIEFSEMTVVKTLDKLLPKKSPFFIGNSMPIRLADMFMCENNCTIYTNRGASGIDGLLASAIGIAKHRQQPMTLLIGDTSFLYDLNSLALLTQLAMPFVIVLINNDGGSIFNMLPVPDAQKERFYQLPHGLEFSAVCQQFSVDYQQPQNECEFSLNYSNAIKNKKSTVIEVRVENGQTFEQLNALKDSITYFGK
ncbi:MAG TPA: 2-succinyl-5-enolpyruvyl-6-hydroxy-3-cyclohexene-1-carboxylic-acid synthase [Psychromonas hadalis]|nr:2-succinyl-5-enolpyruvyl-6-hydroxy-3-cyclohexene-1-carboxylic-acid synthase [Psychromonas hadalis]